MAQASGQQVDARVARRTYHHGDLRNALIEQATTLARAGGPEAIVLREVARATGVSSTAAYRHFAGHHELVDAVKGRGLEMLAARMDVGLAAGEPCSDRADEAMRRLRVAGEAYVHFALDEPGLFRTIFRHHGRDDLPEPADEEREPGVPGAFGTKAYQTMAGALDELVACGRMRADRRQYSDVVLWSATHGMAVLLLDTPLRELPAEVRESIVRRGLDVVLGGLS